MGFKKIKFTTIFLFSTFNALLMVLIALYWLSLSRTYGDEAFFIKWTDLIKKAILPHESEIDENSVLYVDVAGSKTLVSIDDPLYEEDTGYQKVAITDRAQLATFIMYLKKYADDIPIVIMDLVFEINSPDDSLFQSALDSLPFPIIGAKQILSDGQLSECIFDIETGVANYRSSEDLFLKYPLYLNDTLKSLPLKAYSITEQAKLKKWWFIPTCNRLPSLSSPIIDFKIKLSELNDGSKPSSEESFPLRSLGTLLFEWEFWDETDIKALINNKTIIIGDFQSDMHKTIFGSCPGPLIVHNTYLTLKAKEHLIRWYWILFLYIAFFGISWNAFKQATRPKHNKWWQKSKTAVGKIIADSLDDTFFLVLTTVLSFFLFNIHVNILILFVYIKLVSFILTRFVFKNQSYIFQSQKS